MKISKILLLLFLTPLYIFSQNKKRLALVIGISNYSNTLKLENPVNDARLIASSLKEVNFEVILKEDVSKKELADAIKVFSNKLIDSNYEAGFFYYAGHGIQVENTNYLVPIDANIDQNNDKYEIEEKCYSVQRLMSYFNSERLSDKVLISVLDACRNNPFIRNRSIGEGGLSKIDAVSGSLIAYSTEPGKVALDGKGKANSIYSEVLSKNLKTPNLTLEEVFKNVRTEVENQTNYKQSPREESALKGASFYFLKKKNDNKIDIVDIENEFKYLISTKSYEKAISKGNILKEIFKSKVDSISSSKYIDILIELSHIYYKYANDTNKKEGWNYYYKLASFDLLDAMTIIKKYKFNLNDDKYRFSKSLINYINFQAFLSEKDRIDDYKDLLNKGNELIKFNELTYGSNNYLTACSYFIYGWLNRDSSFLEAYKYCNKAYDYIIKNRLEINYDSNYYYLNESDYYILKWNFKTLNELIYSFPSSQLNQFLNGDYQFFYKIYDRDINKFPEFISKYDKQKNYDFYDEIGRFYNNYSVSIDDSSLKINCLEKALKTYELCLKYSAGYWDSLIVFRNIAQSNNNILILYGRIDTTLIEKVDRYALNSLNLCYKNLYSYEFVRSTSQYLSYFNKFYKTNDVVFTKSLFLDVINKFNDYFPYLISDYKSTDIIYKKEWNVAIKELFENIRSSFRIVDSLDFKYKRLEANQFLEFVNNCNTDGYGSPAYLIALEHRAVTLESSVDVDEQIEAKKTYIDLIKLNKQFNKSWKKESIEGCLMGSNSKEECISNLLSDVYYNYSFHIFNDEFDKINNSKDSALIFFFQEFIDEYESSLKKIGKYYYSKIPSVKLMISYFKNINPNKSIALCDSGINVINSRLKLDSTNSANDFITIYGAEEALIWFYNQKRNLLKSKNEKEFLKTTWNFKNSIDLFNEYNKWTPKLGLYVDLLNYYYFNSHNFKALKDIANTAFNENKNFYKSADFLNPDIRNEWKIYVLDFLRQILSRAAENSCAPTQQDRNRCIEQCKLNINTIYDLFDSTEIIQNEFVLNVLLSTYYTIEDLSYFNKDYKTSIIYNKKRIELLKLQNYQGNNATIISQYKWLGINYLKAGDTINAHNAYLEMIENSIDLDTSWNNNFSYTIDTVKYKTCESFFFHLKIRTPTSAWPCIEFDVNNNSKIDTSIDLRYFINNDNLLKIENVKNLNIAIGGYKWAGFNETGEKNDTTKTLFFDKSKPYKSNSYYTLSQDYISEKVQLGHLKKGEKINLWDLYIPIDEILNKDDNTISFLIENISLEPTLNTLSRVYEKNTMPTLAYFTGFKNCIKIKIK